MTEVRSSTPDADVLAFWAPYRVRFDEAGPDGLVRTSNLLRYAQDVGWRHSESLGFDRAWYRKRDLNWVVRAAELEILAPIDIGATVDVGTGVAGYGRIFAKRRAECRLPDGRLAAWIHTDWILIDGRGRVARLPPVFAESFSAARLDAPILRVALPPTPSLAERRTFEVRPQELDPMDHVNNAVYVDWLEESVLGTGGDGATVVTRHPRRYALEYAAAAEHGSRVETASWRDGDGWAHRLRSADGTELFRATLR
jgi:acyl-CoA thioesterase FadM